MALRQNIIYIYFKGKHQVTSKSQYQYNHGQYLYFADLNLPQVFEVHFSNRDKGESKTQIGNDKLVEIPDEYFWNGALQIYAWIYLHSGADDSETIYEIRIPLTKRAKPTDKEPLPVQQSAIDKAIAELNNAVNVTTENVNKTNADKTQVATIKEEVVTLKEEIDFTASAVSQDAQSARESADASEQSAQNSAESERKALDYSDEAKGYAQSALESKDTASQKAQIATDVSAEAKGYRDEAETFKNEAEQAKQNIVDYRDETKGYRDETSNLKNTVQTLKNQVDETAEEIEDISNTVKEDAQNASQSASSASQSSINASQSASQAGKSANDAEESANQAEQNKSQTEIFKNQSEEYKTQAGAFKSQAETFKNQAEEFKNQTETNVTHYPKIIGEYWYVWDATNGEYINTNVDANGIKGDTGRGVASVALNDDYTLTITFTDDTTYTTPSIRGQQGEKGDTGKTGESGVYIGTEEPENEDIKVWIDTDESADSGTVEDLIADITDLKEGLNNIDNRVSVLEQGSSGLTDAVKLALLQLAEKVAYIDDDGQDYYGDLYDALYAVTAISLNTNSLSLVSIGSTSQLTATTVPTGGTVTWSSSDTSIATVNNGLVTAIGYGTATITATAGSASATCSVLVEQASVTSISVVYTQSDAVYTVDSLDILIPDLVVTANWNTGTQTTVNDSDYVLSGTLTTGTSTITVSYGGKTTTFNATVTTAPFTWRYKASSGTLFSESSNLSSVTIDTGVSETLENGYLHLMSPDGQSTEPAVRYYLNPTTNTHAKIKLRVRFIKIPKARGGNGLRIVISNGSSGIRTGVRTVGDKHYLTARQGSSDSDVMELNLDTWYVIEVEKDGSNSVVTVDGTEVFTSSIPSTSYTTENQIFNQSVGTYAYGASIVDVDYIEYYNYDE